MASALPPLTVISSANARRRSTRRAPSTTLAPCVERRRAVASPRPLLAPVMTTTFPSMLLLIILTPACHDGHSAAGHALQLFGVARPLHRDLRGGAFDLLEIVRRKLDGSRYDVLLQAVQLRGARDRHDPRLLSKQPRERDLSRRRLLALTDFAKQIDERLIGFPRLRREARQRVAEIGAVELGVLADLAREEALAEGAVGNEADSEFLHGR